VAAPARELAARLGFAVGDGSLLEEALVHSSYVNEHPDEGLRSNERLEFLGDAVLSLIVSEALWSRYPDDPEGVLTSRRAAIVSTGGLARISDRLGLGDALLVGQGADRTGERRRGSVLAGAFEALLAALYLESGYEAAQDFVMRVAAPELEAGLPASAFKAPKSRLQEHSFAATGRPPAYRLVSMDGPDHARRFVVEVVVGDRALGTGEGRSRREAETEAAVAALDGLAPSEGAPSEGAPPDGTTGFGGRS
jgi:ribonuclease III